MISRTLFAVAGTLAAAFSHAFAPAQSSTTKFGICHVGGGQNCVVDGDTIWVDGQKIRVADVDAPEPIRRAAEDRQNSASEQQDDCLTAKRRSFSLLSAFAGHMILCYGAWDGLYRTGPGLADFMDSSTTVRLRDRFVGKGRS